MDKCPLKNLAQKWSMISEIVSYNIRLWYFFKERVKCHCQGFLYKMDKQNPKRDLSSGNAKGGEGEGLYPERHVISKAVDRQDCMWKTTEGEISNVPESYCKSNAGLLECKSHGPI